MQKQRVPVAGFLIWFATMAFPVDLSASATFLPIDFLIYKKDTLPIYSAKEELLPDRSELHRLLARRDHQDLARCELTVRTYWEIHGKMLYLVKVSSDCSSDEEARAGLAKFFGDKYQRGKVKADWFSGTIFALKGPIIPINWARSPVFRNEWEYVFYEGRLQKIMAHDNSKSKDSPYALKAETLADFIYTSINWDEMPFPAGQRTKVFVRFSANALGKIDSVTVMKGVNPMLDRETVRVIRKIPEWFVIYRHGKHSRQAFYCPVDFSDETRRKYITRRRLP